MSVTIPLRHAMMEKSFTKQHTEAILMSEKIQPILLAVRKVWAELLAAPQLLWRWSAGNTLYRVIVLAAAALAAALLVYILVSLFRAKKKGGTIFALLVLLAVTGAGLWAAQNQVGRLLIPEAATVRVGGEGYLATEQYSLARGVYYSDGGSYVEPNWSLADDTVTWKVNERLAVQLTGLQSLTGNRRIRLRRLSHEGDWGLIGLDHSFGHTGDGVGENVFGAIEVYILPGQQLAEQSWYAPAGEVTQGPDLKQPEFPLTYTILENDGDSVLFTLAHTALDPSDTLGLARQFGPDLVICLNEAFSNRWATDGAGWQESRQYDPLTNAEERAYLAEPLQALLGGSLRLIQDQPEDAVASLLPQRITAYPVNITDGLTGFTLPCRELLEMRGSVFEDYTLRWIGAGPDGGDMLYTIVNSGGWYCNPTTAAQQKTVDAWDEAYLAGLSSPDAEMTAFLGQKAVPYQGGWLLNMGDSVGKTMHERQYYYLTAEPWLPADTGE